MNLRELLAEHIGDPETGWSMGSFGAIAEFHQDPGEEMVVDAPAELTRASARGAIRFDRTRVDHLTPVAYETVSPRAHRWSQALALCLPAEAARASRRSVLTELGPDRDAVRAGDRAAILFDLGLDQPQCDYCIRTADENLLARLRAAAGRAVFEPGNDVMSAILAAHPHRIAVTTIGRIEVFQKIGGPDTGGVSPPGPHTHLLPKLMKSGLTHSANTPIPDGLVPLGYLHPGNPVIGPLGEDRDFRPDLHRAFQALFARYGGQDLVDLKTRLAAALAENARPEDFAVPDGRFARATLRVALRQPARLCGQDDAMAARVNRWRAVFDGRAMGDAGMQDEAPGH